MSRKVGFEIDDVVADEGVSGVDDILSAKRRPARQARCS
jgi:hypothetical protein